MTDVTNGRMQDGAELAAADEQLLRELTERARAGGLKLTGEGGERGFGFPGIPGTTQLRAIIRPCGWLSAGGREGAHLPEEDLEVVVVALGRRLPRVHRVVGRPAARLQAPRHGRPGARRRRRRARVLGRAARGVPADPHSLSVGADSPPSTGTGRRAFTQMEQRRRRYAAVSCRRRALTLLGSGRLAG